MLMLMIAITVSYLMVMIGTILLIAKVDKQKVNHQVIIGFAVTIVVLTIISEAVKQSIVIHFIIVAYFLLSLSYGLYVFQKIKNHSNRQTSIE